jgi:N-acetylneuraminic acid mutarotase
MKKKSTTSQSGPARHSLVTRRSLARSRVGEGGFFGSRVLIAALLCMGVVCLFVTGMSTAAAGKLVFSGHETRAEASQRTLSFAERVAYQRAIEEVYWRHRIWPRSRGENPTPKPPLNEVMSQEQIENKVQDYLRNLPVTPEQLQAEMDRMAQHTRQPEMLHELFAALGNDPFVIAECLARSVLVERVLADSATEQVKQKDRWYEQVAAVTGNYRLPTISDEGGCADDTWTPTSLSGAPDGRVGHTAVWTGSEMIVWGGSPDGVNYVNTGVRYNPSTDSWTRTSTANAPTRRGIHTAVWTGIQMIVWGGFDGPPNGYLNTGGRYNPGTNSWTATSTIGAPAARGFHTAVWTGSEMIIWGGAGVLTYLNTGGRYNPGADSWRATSTTNSPAARNSHTAVWTGSQMIVWGGTDNNNYWNTGGRYNPSADSWRATSTTNAPQGRWYHTAVWTGSQMIIWGGLNAGGFDLNTGGRYNPSIDAWTATSISGAPAARDSYTTVWTGSEMIIWGGENNGSNLNTGGKYNPGGDSWAATTITNAPDARYAHTGVWTGSQMIVWGGYNAGYLNTGGRYCAQSGPTPTATLGNISTRAFVQTSDNVMIGGFIVQGSQTKRVIIRAIGPELGAPPYNIPNAMSNPTLELHNGAGALIASNDNWTQTIIGGIITTNQVHDIMNSGHVPGDGRESAIIADLAPGNYTAIVRGVNNTTGVGLVEVYDLAPQATSILGNISTRSFVQTGDNVMIGGFIVQGTTQKRVIVRAIGPELGAPPYNVPSALADPSLELHNGTGALIGSNDNWQHTIIGGIITTDQVQDIIHSDYAPGDPRESAIIAELRPGNYTAIVRGVNDTTGVALVEVYELDR